MALAAQRSAWAVDAGYTHTCAILDDDSLVCWGSSGYGQLGGGDQTDRATPTNVNLGINRTAKGIALGDNHTCVILDNGSVKCWGLNNYGQLGDGTIINRNAPVSVNLPTGRVAQSHSC